MKFFSSEFVHDYGTYTFGYANYCEREKGDCLDDIYDAGYLPYSGSKNVTDTFYMARSARVVLSNFSLTSENRRIAKKFDGKFSKKRIPITAFDIHNEVWLSFCTEYFKARHGERAASRERILFWLTCGIVTTVVEYRLDNKLIAYVFEAEGDRMGHYWFSFYELSLVRQSLGMWLMLDGIRSAKEAGFAHYYLGTVYGQKALYKTNFEPLEWWNGNEWSKDIKLLKERGRSDEERATSQTDSWKQNHDLF